MRMFQNYRIFKRTAETLITYYHQWIKDNRDLKQLIKQLSNPSSENKMQQMGIPLICEYLKNVGYDVGKPDRHIRRILGNESAGIFRTENTVPEWEALDIIWGLAEQTGKICGRSRL